MNVLTIFGIILATTAVMLLCMRVGMAMTTTPIHNGTVYHAIDGGSIVHNHDKLLVITIQPPVATAELNATDNSTSRDRPVDWISLPAKKTEQSNNNYSSVKHLQQVNSRSLSDTEQADSFSEGLSTSVSGLPRPINLRGTSINIDLHNRNGNIATLDNENVTDDANIHPIKSRQIIERKINHQLNSYRGKYATVAEDEIPAGYQNAYDLTDNADNNGYQVEYENPAYGTGWSSDGRPEPTHPGSSWSGSSGSWEPPPYGMGEEYLTGQGPVGRKPPDRPSTSTSTKNDQNSLQHILLNSVDWKTFGALALLKLGLAKLKVIGFFNTLFLFGFSLKLFMMAVFFKFLLIMKLMKFFKLLLIPLYLIGVLPSLIQLLMMPGRLMNLLRRPTNNNYNDMPMQSPGSAQSSQSSGGLIPSQSSSGSMSGQSSGGSMSSQSSGGLLPSRPNGLLPSQPSSTRRGSNLVRATDDGISINDPHFKHDGDTDLNMVRNHESMQLSDPTLDIFQKLLDSEKCIERIACQVSAAEKTGNVPIWINWLLHRVHELIPNDKLESYLKAYKDVHKEIHTISSVPDSWVTWCSERYDCYSDNVTNAKQF